MVAPPNVIMVGPPEKRKSRLGGNCPLPADRPKESPRRSVNFHCWWCVMD